MSIMSKNVRLCFIPYPGPHDDSGKMWQTARSDLHLHSTFSDGQNSAEEMVQGSIAAGYKEIAITDHVRRTSNWLDQFAAEMDRLKRVYANRIQLFSGIESKVIDLDGNIDALPEFFSEVDLVLAAFHRIPKGHEEYFSDGEIDREPESALRCWYDAMMKLLENEHVDIVAHPEAVLKAHGISVPTPLKCSIAQKAADCHKVFEMNAKYKVPDRELLRALELNKVKLCFGSDSHSVRDILPLAKEIPQFPK